MLSSLTVSVWCGGSVTTTPPGFILEATEEDFFRVNSLQIFHDAINNHRFISKFI